MNRTSLQVGKVSIPHRIKIKDIRRAREKHGVDLGNVTSDGPLMRLNTDPLTLLEVTYALYEPYLSNNGIQSLEALEENVEDEQIDGIRESVIGALSGFFPLLRTISTKMQEVQDGFQNLTAENLMAEGSNPNPSGTNS